MTSVPTEFDRLLSPAMMEYMSMHQRTSSMSDSSGKAVISSMLRPSLRTVATDLLISTNVSRSCVMGKRPTGTLFHSAVYSSWLGNGTMPGFRKNAFALSFVGCPTSAPPGMQRFAMEISFQNRSSSVVESAISARMPSFLASSRQKLVDAVSMLMALAAGSALVSSVADTVVRILARFTTTFSKTSLGTALRIASAHGGWEAMLMSTSSAASFEGLSSSEASATILLRTAGCSELTRTSRMRMCCGFSCCSWYESWISSAGIASVSYQRKFSSHRDDCIAARKLAGCFPTPMPKSFPATLSAYSSVMASSCSVSSSPLM
mmetsp:Transcript_14844/g.56173  ORF Transcript_14844/g.56173 Transcript_14844/m.56173 type:complete len:320 (+) Transcript_14844:14427-15386(+)